MVSMIPRSFQFQNQPSRGSLRKRCSENVYQICTCQSVISIKLLCNFIEITLRHGCSPVNVLHIFKTSFSKNTSGGLLLQFLLWLEVLCLTLRRMFSACKTQKFDTHWKSVDWFLHTGTTAIITLKRRFDILQQARSLNTAYYHY